jgi:uncharacterized protein (TIGR04255 family)
MFIPVSQQHSISRVNANIFLPQSLIKPDVIFRKLNDANLLTSYQKKGVASSKTINLDNNGFQISNDEISGFVFEEFNTVGKSVNVFKVENLNNKSKAQVSFETREYSRWDNFKLKYFDDIESLIKVLGFYIEAISLNYVDEFIWNSNSKIPVESIFNTDAELLNSSFTNSHNGTLVIISQSERKAGEDFKEEKTEILFNNDIKRVIVNHTFAIKLEDIKEYDKSLLETLFNEAHAKNKDLLNKIFTTEVKKQIHLS